ncbi:MAG: ATP-binding cassette domain-containing protein [Alphaproteobacteria bacterium]|nr:ATP-binding cassette domain-containing protein [Alphaproteobacteria bacterium]
MTERAEPALVEEPRFFTLWDGLRWLTARVTRYRGRLALVLIAMAIDVAYHTFVSMSLMVLVDEAIIPGERRVLLVVVGVLVTGFLAAAAAHVVRDYLHAWFAARVQADLRLAMFENLHRLSLRFYGRVSTASILGRFTNDLGQVEGGVLNALPNATIASMYVLVSASTLFALQWQLALLAVSGIPIAMLMTRFAGPRALAAGQVFRPAQTQLNARVLETIEAQPVVKAFDLRESLRRSFYDQATDVLRLAMRFTFLTYLVERLPNLTMLALQVVVIGAGAWLCFEGRLTTGELVAFAALYATISAAVVRLMATMPGLIRATGGAERVNDLLIQRDVVADRDDARELPPFAERLVIDHASFSYGRDRTELSDVSLVIERGSHVALVGPSGCGKSTTLSLLLRFYDPTEGRVTLDGVDLRAAQLASLYAQAAVVFQDNFLFNATIRENIRVGRPEASDAEVEVAASAAELHDQILALPLGYATQVGERGRVLSGGQRQRLALARALVRDPAILLLDEATSALDAATETAVNQTLRRLATTRTVIQATHRLKNVSYVDRLFVFDQGRLIEQGSHAELLAVGGRYAAMWRRQDGVTLTDDDEAEVSVTYLTTIPLFQSLEARLLEPIANAFRTEHLGPGQEVVRQGEAGEKFYIVARGKLEVTALNETGQSRHIAYLEDGDHFGEMALIESSARTATVAAVEPTILLSLRRRHFQKLLELAPALRDAILKISAERAAALARTLA